MLLPHSGDLNERFGGVDPSGKAPGCMCCSVPHQLSYTWGPIKLGVPEVSTPHCWKPARAWARGSEVSRGHSGLCGRKVERQRQRGVGLPRGLANPGPPEGTGSEWTKVLLMRQPWPEARTRSRCLGERSLISAAACRPRVLPAAEEASFTPVLGRPQDTRPQGRAGQHTHQRTHEAAEAENCTAAGKMHA